MGRENYKKERKGSKAGGPPTATTENNGWPREDAFRGEDNIARVLELCHGMVKALTIGRVLSHLSSGKKISKIISDHVLQRVTKRYVYLAPQDPGKARQSS